MVDPVQCGFILSNIENKMMMRMMSTLVVGSKAEVTSTATAKSEDYLQSSLQTLD